ncbi:MAG: amidohydrolase [Coriobacteriales bacterium]|jgi:5-methylthioadenosine/S-adenosylhomocysteine deaminase|nr:amidohydrolase [Coriobacteriales bacterium]
MLFSEIDYLDSNLDVLHGFVGVRDGRIDYVGANDPTHSNPALDYGERYNGAGKLLIPGLYNTHAHAPMVLLRGYAENLPLQQWLYEAVFPFEDRIRAAQAYPAMLVAIAEMLRFGVVSFSDMYFFTEERARAVAESGIKANLCNGLMVFDPDVRYEDMPDKESNERFVRSYHNTLDERLKIDLNIHSEYISNPQVVQAVGQQALELGVNTHIHLSETAREHEECKQRRGGLTPAAYFESLGFFKQPCVAAHCVHTEPEDWQILARNGVTVSANPASNMKLASGFAPVPQMLAAGINVTLGTDGVASNNSHNILKDLYLFALLYKGATGDPTVVTAKEALAAATINGARAQGRLDSGSIAVGNRADVAVLDISGPWFSPQTDLLNNLVYAGQGSDVVLTMVDGAVLYRDGIYPTIDVKRAIFETQQATQAILASL